MLLQETLEGLGTPPPQQIEKALNCSYHDYLRSMSLEGVA